MQYEVISCPSAKDLTEKVNAKLATGWKLHGHMQANTVESWGHFKKQGEHLVYSQTVVLETQ